MHRSHLPFAALAVPILLYAPAALAQSNRPATVEPPPAPPAEPGPAGPAAAVGVVELANQPSTIDAIGLTLHLPVSSTAQTTTVGGGRSRTVITPDNSGYVLQIFNSVTTDKELTAQAALDAIIQQRQRAARAHNVDDPGVRSAIEAFDRDDELIINGMPASRVYLRHAHLPDFPNSGYTVFRTAPGQFVIFQVDCPAANFEQVRTIFETVIAAASFKDPKLINADRAAAVRAGKAFLAQLNAAVIEAALPDDPVFFRVYAPAASGDPDEAREIGWQRLEIRTGQRGELDPDRPREDWLLAEREQGFIVRIEARMLHQDAVFDSRAICFLSRDRTEEAWSIVMEHSVGGTVQRSSQTLARKGSKLSVTTDLPGEGPTQRSFQLIDDHYLSGVERYLLPRLVAHLNRDEPAAFYDLGYYAYDPARQAVSLRRDLFEKTPGGGWKVTTEPVESAAEWTSTHDDDGALVQRILSPIRVMQRTTPSRILALWQDKGLPTD